MNIPTQVPFVDTAINYLFGLLCTLASLFYLWNFASVDVFNLAVNLKWIDIFIFIFLPYLIGLLFSGTLFAFLLRISVFSAKSPLNKFEKFIGASIFGIKQLPDGRIVYLNDSFLDRLIKKKIKSVFSLNTDNLSDASKRELFYVIMRYIDNYAQGDINRLERLYLTSNALSSTVLFLLLLFAVNTIALVNSLLYNSGNIDLPALISIETATLLLIRYLAYRFQSNLLFWWKNVWRSFLVVEGKSPMKVKKRVSPLKTLN